MSKLILRFFSVILTTSLLVDPVHAWVRTVTVKISLPYQQRYNSEALANLGLTESPHTRMPDLTHTPNIEHMAVHAIQNSEQPDRFSQTIRVLDHWIDQRDV